MASITTTYVAKNIADLGDAPMVHLLVVRRRKKDLIELGSFLVDTGCLGVKDAFYKVLYDETALEELKEDMFHEGCEEKSGAWGRRFVEAAIQYAQRLGFGPHRDFKKAARVFGGTNAKDCDESFAFGQNGKPFYMQGPHDSYKKAQKVISILTKRCGEEGFHYLVGGLSGEATPEEELSLCQELLEHGELEESWRRLSQLNEENPEDLEVIFGMGTWHAAQGNFEEALPFFKQVTSEDSEFDAAWLNQGMVHMQLSTAEEGQENFLPGGGNMKHLALMLKCFQQVIRCDQEQPGEVDEEGLLRCKNVLSGFTEEAELSKISMDVYIESMEIYSLGLDLMEEEEWVSGLEQFKKTAELNPRSHQAFGNMGTCLLQLNRVNDGREMLERAIEIEPDYTPALSNLKIIEGCDDENPPKIREFKIIDSSKFD